MKAFHKRRILKLAAFLDKVPDENFDLASFTRGYGTSTLKSLGNKILKLLRIKSRKKVKPECGSAACAIGYLPVVFPRSFEYHYTGVQLKENSSNNPFSDVKKFLGLENTNGFFMEYEYEAGHRTGKDVAARLRKYVKDRE